MTPGQIDRLSRCFADGNFFLAYILHGSDNLVFAGPGEVSLKPWHGCGPDTAIPRKGISEQEYVARMEKLVCAMRRKELTKVVVCRVICGAFSNFNPAAMASEYFAQFPQTLRFVFGSKACGWWMGSTPELVLESDSPAHFHTIALAGTRPADTQSPWSSKDLAEHRVVVDALGHTISNIHGCRYTSHCETVAYGKIEHLCTHFDVDCPAADADARREFVQNAHPTPAICGSPRDKAMQKIAEFEDFQRGYYAGLITIDRAEKLIAYAMLRCAHFDKERWAVYTGSGITADSNPHDEFKETAYKAAPLVNLFTKY